MCEHVDAAWNQVVLAVDSKRSDLDGERVDLMNAEHVGRKTTCCQWLRGSGTQKLAKHAHNHNVGQVIQQYFQAGILQLYFTQRELHMYVCIEIWNCSSFHVLVHDFSFQVLTMVRVKDIWSIWTCLLDQREHRSNSI